MHFLAFFRAKYFFVQNSRVLRQLIGDFWKGFVKNFRNESLPLSPPWEPPPNLPLGGGNWNLPLPPSIKLRTGKGREILQQTVLPLEKGEIEGDGNPLNPNILRTINAER